MLPKNILNLCCREPNGNKGGDFNDMNQESWWLWWTGNIYWIVYVREGQKDTLFHEIDAYAMKPVEEINYKKLLIY